MTGSLWPGEEPENSSAPVLISRGCIPSGLSVTVRQSAGLHLSEQFIWYLNKRQRNYQWIWCFGRNRTWFLTIRSFLISVSDSWFMTQEMDLWSMGRRKKKLMNILPKEDNEGILMQSKIMEPAIIFEDFNCLLAPTKMWFWRSHPKIHFLQLFISVSVLFQ